MYNSFTYHSYITFLRDISRTHRVATFREFDREQYEKCVILRHDVDYSLEKALDMARLEKENNFHATYFILVRTDYYYLYNETNIGILLEIGRYGHEIGLHYDMSVYDIIYKDKNYRKIMINDAKILENLVGKPVTSVSRHDPSVHGEEVWFDKTGYVDAYDDQYIKNMAYFSDSCGRFKEDFIEICRTGNFPDRFQLLIHPIFWNETPQNRYEGIRKGLAQRVEALKAYYLKYPLLWK